MYPVLQIAGLALNTAGLMVLLAGWLGTALAAREAERLQIDGNVVWDAAFYAVVVGLIAARLWYVGAHWSAYQTDLRQVLALNLGTLALGPGVIIAAIVSLAYLLHRRISLSRIADALAPGLLLGLAVLRVGDYLTGRVLGTPTSVPWAVELWGVSRHPVALYEAGGALVALGIVWRLRDRKPYDGFIFLIALLCASMARLFLETYRADSPQVTGGFRVVQFASLTIILVTLGILYLKQFEGKVRS